MVKRQNESLNIWQIFNGLKMKNKTDYEVIVLTDEWDGLPFSCKHLLRHFLPEIQLIWVQVIGLRSPRLDWYDIKRSIFKILSWIAPKAQNKSKAYPDNLTLVNPIQIPYNQFRLVRWLNKLFMLKAIRKVLNMRKARKRILLTTWPFLGNFVGEFGEAISIYYRVDDYAEFPGVNKQLIERLENELVSKVDIVIATAENLLELPGVNNVRQYLPQGVDYEHFVSPPPDAATASKMSKIKTPIIGFFGVLDQWIDIELIGGVAMRHPEWSFVIIGPSQIVQSKLPRQKNIYYLGPVEYEKLPGYAKYFDVGLIPFKINKLTLAVNPLKLMEYFSLGIPVVSTPLPEVAKYNELVEIGSDAKELEEAIKVSLESDSEEKQNIRRELAKEHGWEKKSLLLRELIENNLENG